MPSYAARPAAAQLRGVEPQAPLLALLVRPGLEGREDGRAAAGPAAGAGPAVHLRFVADADLPHLDPRAELRRQLAHELAEVDAAIRREIENQLRPVERLLDARELHPQPALADLQHRDAAPLLLPLLILPPPADLLLRPAPPNP